MPRILPLASLASLLFVGAMHCGGGDENSSGAVPIDGQQPPTESEKNPGGGANSPPAACGAPTTIDAITKCLDEGGAPRKCLADATTPTTNGASPAAPLCDVDQDGLDDALEDAMIRSYAPVFAFNKGGDGHTSGDSEPVFPTNAAHFVSHSTLYWRVDDDDTTKTVVDKAPTLATLPTATFEVGGALKKADSLKLGEGPNFWLCLNKEEGNYPKEAIVSSMEASRTLEGGVDIFAVAHPTGKDPAVKGEFVVLEYMLFYPYNQFTLDDHEGDFEGGAVFVSLDTGKVVAVYTDRHPTSDDTKLIALEGSGGLPAKDPSGEDPHYNVCSDTSSGSAAGGRFWDYGTNKHHPVIYVAAGGHASYGYPGATKIKGAGCLESTIIRDVHNGEGPKLVPFENAYYTDWGHPDGEANTPNAPPSSKPIVNGMHFRNLGERAHLREAWSAFAGQWGCTLANIPKSYPGPWDNERLCRHWLTNDWGDKPPFTSSNAASCSQ